MPLIYIYIILLRPEPVTATRRYLCSWLSALSSEFHCHRQRHVQHDIRRRRSNCIVQRGIKEKRKKYILLIERILVATYFGKGLARLKIHQRLRRWLVWLLLNPSTASPLTGLALVEFHQWLHQFEILLMVTFLCCNIEHGMNWYCLVFLKNLISTR